MNEPSGASLGLLMVCMTLINRLIEREVLDPRQVLEDVDDALYRLEHQGSDQVAQEARKALEPIVAALEARLSNKA